jgi:DNA-binding NarL/FixJ family response regulator
MEREESHMKETYDVILVDDHLMFRLGIKKILEASEDVKVVGEASDGQELLSLLNQVSPHMVILDISMPKISGIDATREIKQTSPHIKVLILTMHNNIEYLQHAMSVGAEGYVLKQDAGTELFSAIDSIRSGGIYISPSFSLQLKNEFIKSCRGEITPGLDLLTARQREVVTLIAEGKTGKEIASILFISSRTVEKHRSQIMRKLNLESTADIVKYAINKKYIMLDT